MNLKIISGMFLLLPFVAISIFCIIGTIIEALQNKDIREIIDHLLLLSTIIGGALIIIGISEVK